MKRATKPIPEPKYLVIGMRSFAGSRTALLNVAIRMLVASKAIEAGGGASLYRCFEDDQHREFLAAAVLYRTRLLVESVIELVRSVEAVLQDPQGDPARPAIELRLLWMEGVELATPEVLLPSPLLETQRWASLVFVEAAEQAIIAAVEDGTESSTVLRRIGNAYVNLKSTSRGASWSCATGGLCGKSLTRTPDGIVLETAAVDRSDVLASAADLVLVSESDAHRITKIPANQPDSSPAKSAEEALKKTRPSVIVPVAVDVYGTTSDDGRILLWLEEIRRVAVSECLYVTDVIVWADTEASIRGAILGQRVDRLTWSRAVLGVETSTREFAPSPTIGLSIKMSR